MMLITGAIYMGLDHILRELSQHCSIRYTACLLGMPTGILLLTASNALHQRQEEGKTTLHWQ